IADPDLLETFAECDGGILVTRYARPPDGIRPARCTCRYQSLPPLPFVRHPAGTYSQQTPSGIVGRQRIEASQVDGLGRGSVHEENPRWRLNFGPHFSACKPDSLFVCTR